MASEIIEKNKQLMQSKDLLESKFCVTITVRVGANDGGWVVR